nr:hypothetical protein [Tanacetum cinerariifolium]
VEGAALHPLVAVGVALVHVHRGAAQLQQAGEVLLGKKLAGFELRKGGPKSQNSAVCLQRQAKPLLKIPIDLAAAPARRLGQRLYRTGPIGGVEQAE